MDIAVILVLVLANAVFAMSELALVSSRKGRLQAAAEKGSRGAAAALALAEEPTRFLSTVQIGITLVGIMAGAYGGAALSRDLAGWLGEFPAVAPYARGLAFALVVIAITYLSLVVGELVPKRLAIANPERIAIVVARPMSWLSRAAGPAVWFLTVSTELILKAIGRGPAEEHAVTEEDIKGMVRQAAGTGAVHQAERVLVDRVFWLGDRKISGMMVPRGEIEWLEESVSAERLRVALATSVHSHYPVCRGGLDHVLGVVHIKDLIKIALLGGGEGGELRLTETARPPLFVPETTTALKLLDTFKETGRHLALVVDEYGSLQGLVTFNDIAHSMIGAVEARQGPSEPLVVRRGEGSWLVDGALSVEELRELMGRGETPEEEWDEADVRTVGGLMMTRLGHIPRSGESFEWEGFRFEVVDMDKNRVDKVMLTRTTAGG